MYIYVCVYVCVCVFAAAWRCRPRAALAVEPCAEFVRPDARAADGLEECMGDATSRVELVKRSSLPSEVAAKVLGYQKGEGEERKKRKEKKEKGKERKGKSRVWFFMVATVFCCSISVGRGRGWVFFYEFCCATAALALNSCV